MSGAVKRVSIASILKSEVTSMIIKKLFSNERSMQNLHTTFHSCYLQCIKKKVITINL